MSGSQISWVAYFRGSQQRKARMHLLSKRRQGTAFRLYADGFQKPSVRKLLGGLFLGALPFKGMDFTFHPLMVGLILNPSSQELFVLLKLHCCFCVFFSLSASPSSSRVSLAQVGLVFLNDKRTLHFKNREKNKSEEHNFVFKPHFPASPYMSMCQKMGPMKMMGILRFSFKPPPNMAPSLTAGLPWAPGERRAPRWHPKPAKPTDTAAGQM